MQLFASVVMVTRNIYFDLTHSRQFSFRVVLGQFSKILKNTSYLCVKSNITKVISSWKIRMDKPLSLDDIAAMENQLRNSVELDRRYWRVNDVKCDAVHSAKTYEEFADRVAAAHLRPLEKADYKSKNKGWNQYAPKEKESD